MQRDLHQVVYKENMFDKQLNIFNMYVCSYSHEHRTSLTHEHFQNRKQNIKYVVINSFIPVKTSVKEKRVQIDWKQSQIDKVCCK